MDIEIGKTQRPGLPEVSEDTLLRIVAAFSEDERFVATSIKMLAKKDPELLEMLSSSNNLGANILIGGLLVWRMLDAENPNLPPSSFNSLMPPPTPPEPAARERENPALMQFIEATEELGGGIGMLRKMGAMVTYEWKRRAVLELPHRA